ncbi:MAG: class II fructose-bisphosphate aldolase [bacterium]
MKTLSEIITNAEKEKKAIGHFNISDIVTLHAIAYAARDLSVPVIIGVSEGERAFLGTKRAVDMIHSVREEYGLSIYLNSDHTHTLEDIKIVVDAGFDAAVFDPVAKARKEGRDFSFEDHIKVTKEAVEYAKSVNNSFIVEGELGYIGSSSTIWDEIPAGADISADALTRAEEARQFVQETGVGLLAPSVGNIHGMFSRAANPRLDIERIRDIRTHTNVSLVLHGGSGICDEDFISAIESGIGIVHINTELRVAWRKAMERSLGQNIHEIVPYKLLTEPQKAVYEVAAKRLRLFNHILNV